MSRLRIGLVLCVLSLLAGTAGQARGQDTNPFAGDAAAIAEGEKALGADGRLLIRKSGTEPVIRIMGEAEDEALLSQVVERIADAIAEAAAAPRG